MQYFAVCDNPFSARLEKKLRDKLSKDYSTKKAHIELLQIDDIRHDINLELKKYDLEIENVCIFYYKSMVHNEIHIDLYNNHVINSSLAIPWILNDSYHVYWVTGKYKFAESTYDKVQYLKLEWEEYYDVAYETKVSTPVIFRTNVPHAFRDSNLEHLIATFRFMGNPTFEELQTKFNL